LRSEISGPYLIRNNVSRTSIKAIPRPFFEQWLMGSRGPCCTREPQTAGFKVK
jgi:hypothetical protein